jgi:hypothetical protein
MLSVWLYRDAAEAGALSDAVLATIVSASAVALWLLSAEGGAVSAHCRTPPTVAGTPFGDSSTFACGPA